MTFAYHLCGVYSVLIPYAPADTVYCSYILMNLQYSDTGIYFYYTDYLNYYICSEVTKCKGPVKLVIYRLPVQTMLAGVNGPFTINV